jgi:hypothetical protein
MPLGSTRGIAPIVAVMVLAVTAISVVLVLAFAPGSFLGLIFVLAGLWLLAFFPSLNGVEIGASLEVMGFVLLVVPETIAFSASLFGGLL